MAEIRTLCPEERESLEKIVSIAYNNRRDFSESKPDNGLQYPIEWLWGSFDTNGRLQSGIAAIPYRMRFDGHTVGMCGIGGVCTLPEYRRGGNVFAIMQRILETEYEKGTEFSCLSPFSHTFYRRMGYELCNCRNELSAPLTSFHQRMTGTFIQHFPGDSTEALQCIQTSYIADLNHATPRNEIHPAIGWCKFCQNDPYKTGVCLYIWHDGSGIPKAYIKLEQVTAPTRVLAIHELVFVDQEALYGTLSLLSSMASLADDTMRWQAPMFIPFTDILPENWDITLKMIPRDMTRVVHVQRVLERMRYPQGRGSYRVKVLDQQLPDNTGVYEVEYEEDRRMVSRTKKAPDITVSIQAFSQLATGFRTLDDALLTRRNDLQVHNNLKTLREVFTKRPSHLTEAF